MQDEFRDAAASVLYRFVEFAVSESRCLHAFEEETLRRGFYALCQNQPELLHPKRAGCRRRLSRPSTGFCNSSAKRKLQTPFVGCAVCPPCPALLVV